MHEVVVDLQHHHVAGCELQAGSFGELRRHLARRPRHELLRVGAGRRRSAAAAQRADAHARTGGTRPPRPVVVGIRSAQLLRRRLVDAEGQGVVQDLVLVRHELVAADGGRFGEPGVDHEAAVVVAHVGGADVGLGEGQFDVGPDRHRRLDAVGDRRGGVDVERPAGVGPGHHGVDLALVERHRVLQRDADVARRPRRHVAGADGQAQTRRHRRRVRCLLQAPHRGADAAVVVARRAVGLQDGLHGGGERRPAGRRRLHALRCGDLVRRLELVGVDGDQIQPQPGLVGGRHEPDQVDGPDAERLERHGRLGVDVQLGAVGAHLGAQLDRCRRLLDGQVAVHRHVVGLAVGHGVGQPVDRRGAVRGERKGLRLEEVVLEALVAQRLVRGELLHVDHDLAEAGGRRVGTVEADVAGDAAGRSGRGVLGAGELLGDLVGRRRPRGVDAVDGLARRCRCEAWRRRHGERHLHLRDPQQL